MFDVTINTITRTYLANNRDSTKLNGIRIWNFTEDRKWRPLHNAVSFGEFEAVGESFDEISISSKGDYIIFGKKTVSKNISIDILLDDLANSTFEIKRYYFVTPSGYAFLAQNRYELGGIQIFEHVKSGKWKPVHNAESFDGYPRAKNIFSNISITTDGRQISISYFKFNIPTIDKVLPRETVFSSFNITSSFTDDEYSNNTDSYIFSTNPYINWSNIPPNTESLAIEVFNLQDEKSIWRVVNIDPGDSNSSYIPEDSDIDYNGMTTLVNDYDFTEKFYGNVQGDNLITIYAVLVKNVTSIYEAKQNSIGYANILYKAP